MTTKTTIEPTGRHLIAGEWVATGQTFESCPVSGPAIHVCRGTPELVTRAARAAGAAFPEFAATPRRTRARLLEAIADAIEARADAITAICMRETGLPEPRVVGERGRTTGQLRLFAQVLRSGDYLDRRHDPADPARQPLPRPELRMIQRPLGPVAVFGASNFPLAFSVAGGDTASALAAGCPVVVKGHEAHPGTGEVVAGAIAEAVESLGLPAGTFSLVQGGGIDVGQALVRDPHIAAVGFTGSLRAGRALFDLCAARPDPIPFFGELGSVNPVFVLPGAARARAREIGEGWAASLTLGAGQFCTNPGLLVVEAGAAGDAVVAAARAKLEAAPRQVMLTPAMAEAYRAGRDRIAGLPGVRTILRCECGPREAAPALAETEAERFLSDPALAEEVFGPFGLILRVRDREGFEAVAAALQGQLTATLQIVPDDHDLAARLVPVLERKAGRLIANGFPTGVEVSPAMVHGGPWPATTAPGHTSVGTLAIRRWLRPVCYQDMPDDLLPEDLRADA